MRKGIYFALGTAIISGFSIFMAKIFVSTMDPVVFTTLKNVLVAGVLSAIIFSRQSLKSKLPKISRKDWYKLFAIGLIGGSIPFALFFTGLATVTAPGAAIIHKTLFIWIALLAITFLKEKLSILQMIGYVLILWGAMWISGLERFTTWGQGEYMILAATILWAIEIVIAKKTLKNVPSEIVAWSRMFFGSLILIGIVVATGKANVMFNLGIVQLQAVLIGALFLTGYVLNFYKALSYAPATVVSVILSLSTIVTAILAALFINNAFPQVQLTSSILIGLGVGLITWFGLKQVTLQKKTV